MNTIDKLIMEGEKICVFSIKYNKESVYDSIAEAHRHHAKNHKVSEIYAAIKKLDVVAGVLFYPESKRSKAQVKIRSLKHVVNFKTYEKILKDSEKGKKKVNAMPPGKRSPVIVYDLETDERTEYKSLHEASSQMMLPFFALQNSANKHQPFGMYFVLRKEEEAEFVKLLPYYKAKYKREIKKCKKKETLDQSNFVWLRVDAKTEILVPKEKATKEYAEWFNIKRLNQRTPSYDVWIKNQKGK